MWKLGVIADDFTGATDIAGFLAANGVATIQVNGIPGEDFEADAGAFVVSLKSRSCASSLAVKESLKALNWLKAKGCSQIFFKYCSTFDSTPEGNIGPVTDALLQALGEDITIICPALPVNGRTLYQGYLFVYDELLNESGMKNHPLNPMTDAKIGRVMEAQAQGRACSLYADLIDQGADVLRQAIRKARAEGFRYVVVDTLSDDHLDIIARACRDLPLVTGGSGLAASLAKLAEHEGGTVEAAIATGRPRKNPGVIFSGSCSTATNRQVQRYRQKAASHYLSAERCLSDPDYLQDLFDWTVTHLEDPYAPLLYATTAPGELGRIKASLPGQDIGLAIEKVFGALALKLKNAGVQNFIVAGGETSGMVVQSLGLSGFHVGPQIDPGVPWVKAVGQPIYLALKSGNFGSDDFFAKAQEELE